MSEQTNPCNNPNERIIKKAVRQYRHQVTCSGRTDYTVADALVYALEELDTGYDLTKDQWQALEDEIAMEVSHAPQSDYCRDPYTVFHDMEGHVLDLHDNVSVVGSITTNAIYGITGLYKINGEPIAYLEGKRGGGFRANCGLLIKRSK